MMDFLGIGAVDAALQLINDGYGDDASRGWSMWNFMVPDKGLNYGRHRTGGARAHRAWKRTRSSGRAA